MTTNQFWCNYAFRWQELFEQDSDELKPRNSKLSVPRGQKLLPVETESEIEDQYNSRNGRIEHEYNMRETFGKGFEETAVDKRHAKVLRDNQDRPIKDGDKLPQFDTVGGLGSAQNVQPLGASQPAWYSSWWASGMKLHPIWDALEHMTGLRGLKDGKDELVDSGINVDGWEPGRSEEQVKIHVFSRTFISCALPPSSNEPVGPFRNRPTSRRQVLEDERSDAAVPAGFWKADLTPAYTPDVVVHHPCGSPLRRRPCPANFNRTNHSDPSLQVCARPRPLRLLSVIARATSLGCCFCTALT